MTKQQELEIYEKALIAYQCSIGKDLHQKSEIRTDHGLCNYFYQVHGIDIYYLNQLDLPVIEKLILDVDSLSAFVFPEGEIEPRIELLKTAIEIVEKQIKESSNK